MRLSEEKQITSTLRQFQPEGAGLKYKLQKNFRSTQTASSSFLLLAVNVAAPFIGMAVGGSFQLEKHTELVKIDKIQKCRKFNLLDDRQHFIKAYIFIKVKEEGLN